MPKYVFEARDLKGNVIQGEGTAASRAELTRELETRQLTVLGLREKPALRKRLHRALQAFSQVGTVELAIFTRQLSLLMSAGIPILRALATLLNQSWSRHLRVALTDVLNGVRDGHGLSASLARNPRAFGVVFVSMVRAGEVSGGLDETLKRLADFLERDMRLYQKLKASLTYPALVFIASFAMVAFMVLHVFPAFIGFFNGLNLELPLLTRVVLEVTRTLANPLVIVALVLLGPYLMVRLYRYFSATPSGLRKWSWVLLHLPVISKVQRDVILARFCRTLGILIECGIPQLHALEVAGSVVGNALVQQEVREAAARLRDGGAAMSYELLQTSFFPPVCGHMLRVAEEAGRTPIILFKLADFYESELDISIQTALALLEPIMLTIMGGLVGFILLAVFMPIYSLLDAI